MVAAYRAPPPSSSPLDFSLFIFANVGADSENPATLEFVERFAKPYAAGCGVELAEVQKHRRTGEADTIRQWLDRTDKSIGIPMRMANGAPGNRTCTEQFKINVVNKELKRRGASAESPAILGMGISTDEWQRMRSDSGAPYKKLAYPLIDLGLSRQDCMLTIERAGLPVPPKSSCYFCPFKRTGDWQKMRRDEPALFALSVELEEQMNVRRARLGRDSVFLSSRAIPLTQVVGDHDQLDLFEEGSCDIAGYCHN
jgi:hypothetical protein